MSFLCHCVQMAVQTFLYLEKSTLLLDQVCNEMGVGEQGLIRIKIFVVSV